MNKYLVPGAVVTATAGRERGEIFIILSVDENNAYIINGQTRTIENPKKKRKKHLHLLCKSELTGLELDLNQLTDAQVKNFLNNYSKSRVK
ncbi:MAG: RNA-binding protein [Christensenellales bacterium]